MRRDRAPGVSDKASRKAGPASVSSPPCTIAGVPATATAVARPRPRSGTDPSRSSRAAGSPARGRAQRSPSVAAPLRIPAQEGLGARVLAQAAPAAAIARRAVGHVGDVADLAADPQPRPHQSAVGEDARCSDWSPNRM